MLRKSIPNVFTLGNLFCGVLSIVMASNGYLVLAGLLIFLGAVCDFLDGFMARLLDAKSAIGAQLDSLSDLVTFGVAPAVIAYNLMVVLEMDSVPFYMSDLMTENGQSGFHEMIPRFNLLSSQTANVDGLFPYPNLSFSYWFYLISCLLFPLFGAYRLARFNTLPASKDFSGLPIPAAGIFLASLPLIAYHNWISGHDTIKLLQSEYILAYVLCLGVLMVVPLKMFSLKFETFGWKGNETRFVFLLFALIALILFLGLGNPWLFFPLSVMLYILISLIDQVRNKV